MDDRVRRLGVSSALLRWVETVSGREVTGVVELRGGRTSTMLALTVAGGRRLVLRLMDREPWLTHAVDLLRRESNVQHQLVGTGIPAPTSVAIDVDASYADAPAHLMTWLPGELELRRCDGAVLERLAQLLVDIHRFRPSNGLPRPYQSWAVASKRKVPQWSRQPALWRAAFDVLEEPAPPHVGVFLHRDFHLGNVLWRDGHVSGVVDWVETSWGPAQLDVAHARTFLAMLHGGDAAEEFAQAFNRLAGVSSGRDGRVYWDVMDVVGYLPSPDKVAGPWRDLGIAVSDEQAQDRLEAHLATVLTPTN